MNDTQIIKEKIDRLEKMAIDIYARLDSLQDDIQRTVSIIKVHQTRLDKHINNPDGHKI